MPFDQWTTGDQEDAGRARRLAGSYAAAAILVGALLAVGVVFGGRIKSQVFEEEVDVKFVPPEPVKPAPPPPPPPPAPPRVASKAPPPKGSPREAPPTELPKAPPAEGDPDHPRDASEGGDPDGVVGGTGTGSGGAPAPTATIAAPSPPPPPPAPLVQVAEASTPPVPRSKSMPAYPEDARRQGIETVIVVKLVIDERGDVEDVRIVRGHPLFDAPVLAAVRTWTFEPGTLDGRPIRVARLVKIPFRLKHAQNTAGEPRRRNTPS